MTPSTVQVAPDGSGKKIQTFTDGTQHAQAVILVDSSGTAYTPLTLLETFADNTTLDWEFGVPFHVTMRSLASGDSFKMEDLIGFDLVTTQGHINLAIIDSSIVIDEGATNPVDITSGGSIAMTCGDQTAIELQDVHGNGVNVNPRPLFGAQLASSNGAFYSQDGLTYFNNNGFVGSGTGLTGLNAALVGLGNVTNDTQTKSVIVPNTAPAPNVILIGNASGTAYVPSTPAFPNASAASGKFIRSDGTNWIASTPSLPTSAGVAGKILRSDGTNYIESTPTYPNSGIAGTIIVSDGTNFVTSTPTFPNASASSGKFIRSDGTNWVASTPTLPTTAGVAGKVLYTNGTNYLESVPALPVTAAAITGKIMQSDGTNWIASTATHPTAATLNKLVIGNGTNYVESTPAFPNASAITGKIIQSDGTNWIASTPTFPAAAGTNGNILVSDGTNFTSAARLMQQASGTSTSGTNGTIVARMVAGAGNQLVGFTAFTDQTAIASTQTNINIGYSDGTFTTASSNPNLAIQMFVNYAAILVTQAAQFVSLTALSAKKVTSINITTQNTGTGTRGAMIAAEEIPMS